LKKGEKKKKQRRPTRQNWKGNKGKKEGKKKKRSFSEACNDTLRTGRRSTNERKKKKGKGELKAFRKDPEVERPERKREEEKELSPTQRLMGGGGRKRGKREKRSFVLFGLSK